MRNQPVPLVTGFYADQDRPFSQQDVWNYLPCRAEKQGARSPLMLKTPPGLFPWLELEGAPPVRGLHDCEGRLFAVIGSTLYRLTPKGVAVPIGTIPGNGRVSMDHNQRANGQQLTVVNGSAGYVYDTYADTFERITDTGFPGSPVIRFMDGYMLGLDPAGRFAFSSGAANALDYNTLDRWTSEYRPDRLVGMGRLGGELLLLSANSGEFFGNTGAAQQPFRSKRIFLDKGCAGPHTVVEADNTVFWLGSDGYFYQLDGYNSRRISTRPIEQAIRGQDWWNAFAFVWESEGHTVVYWTFLNGQTWGWDTSQQEWHRRESYGLDRWRPSCTARSGKAWYAGDFQKGRIWRLDWGYPWEGDTEFVSGFTLPVIHDNQNELVHSRLELVMDVGAAAVAAAEFAEHPTAPTISGNAPDTFIGADYSYAYTATGGTAPLRFSLRGDLPPGIALDPESGVVSGASTAAGHHVFTVRVTDANGLWAEVEDSIRVGAAFWLLRTTAAADSRAWVSGDGMDWAGPYTRAPFVVAAGKASHQLYDGTVLVVGPDTTGELIEDTRVSGGIGTESISVPGGVGRIRTIGGVTAAFYGSNNAEANTYWLLSGGNRIWEAVTLPGGRRIRDIARDEAGRWWSYQDLNATYGMYYSDEDVPRNWIASGYSEPAHGERAIASGGDMLMMLATLNRVMRRKGGVWSTLTPGGAAAHPDARAALYSEGRWIFVGQRTSGGVNLIYSDDDGQTFVAVTIPGIDAVENIYAANGRLVASGTAITEATGRATVCVSDDNGTSWAQTNHPYAVESGGAAVAFPVR